MLYRAMLHQLSAASAVSYTLVWCGLEVAVTVGCSIEKTTPFGVNERVHE